MNVLFGIFYLLFGAAWTFVAISAGNIGIFAAVLAAVSFYASWGKFFGGGIALRIVHVGLGSLIVLVWVVAMIDLALHLTGHLHWIDTGGLMGYLEVFIGGILLPAVIAYVVDFSGWLGQRRRRARAGAASIAPNAPAQSTKEETEVESMPHRAEEIAVRAPVNRSIRRVGLALLVLLIAGVTFRALLGDDIMCHGGNAKACLTVAAKDVKLKLWNESPCHFADAWSYNENGRICGEVAQRYVERDELERAIEIHEDVWKRYKDTLLAAHTNAVDGNWRARTELLIRLHATSRIDATAEEVCSAETYQSFYCESLIVALQRAKYVDSMDKTSLLACRSSPEPECRLYGNWLIDSGRRAAGLDVLRTSCMNGQAHSCTSLGFALANGRDYNYADARWALRRACELKSSTCSEMLRVEHQFVSDDEVRADARDVCRRFPGECVAASRIIGSYLRDSVGAREILMQMCEQSPNLKEYPCNPLPARSSASVAESRASLSLSPPPAQLKFSEGGTVSTQIVWSEGVLTLRLVGGFGPQQGRVFEDRRVVPTANAWKALDAELRTLGVWSWPPLVATGNSPADRVGWTFVVTTAERSFSSSGYDAYPEHFRDVVAALKKLADGASDAPPLTRIGP